MLSKLSVHGYAVAHARWTAGGRRPAARRSFVRGGASSSGSGAGAELARPGRIERQHGAVLPEHGALAAVQGLGSEGGQRG